MRIKFTNHELVAMVAIVRETCDKYTAMIEDMHDENRKRVAAGRKPEDNDSDINQAQLSKAIFESLFQHLDYRSRMVRAEYAIELTPVWAFAIRLEFNGIVDVRTQIGNSLQIICNTVHQQYQ